MHWDRIDNSSKQLIVELIRSLDVHTIFDKNSTKKQLKEEMTILHNKIQKIELIIDGSYIENSEPKKFYDEFSKYEEG